MGEHTTDPNDPRLLHGVDTEPVAQNDVYLVLSEEDRAKGFVRPVRRTYVHWTQEDGSPVPHLVLSTKGFKGCGVATTMSLALAETYARDPKFYGATYCVGCQMHLPVSEFTWDATKGSPPELVGS
jgi:hypothetical protein